MNVTEKPLQSINISGLPAEDSQFVDSPYKVYVGNLAKTVTSDTLKDFFAEKGKVLSVKVSRVPGTSKSSGYGFVSFSSEEEVEAVISTLNNAVNNILFLTHHWLFTYLVLILYLIMILNFVSLTCESLVIRCQSIFLLVRVSLSLFPCSLLDIRKILLLFQIFLAL